MQRVEMRRKESPIPKGRRSTGRPRPFLSRPTPSPEASKMRTVRPKMSLSSKGDKGERKNCTKGSTELASIQEYKSKPAPSAPPALRFGRWPITCSKVLTSTGPSVPITVDVPRVKVKRGSLGSKPRDIATSCHFRVGRRPATETLFLHSSATSGELEACMSLPD